MGFFGFPKREIVIRKLLPPSRQDTWQPKNYRQTLQLWQRQLFICRFICVLTILADGRRIYHLNRFLNRWLMPNRRERIRPIASVKFLPSSQRCGRLITARSSTALKHPLRRCGDESPIITRCRIMNRCPFNVLKIEIPSFPPSRRNSFTLPARLNRRTSTCGSLETTGPSRNWLIKHFVNDCVLMKSTLCSKSHAHCVDSLARPFNRLFLLPLPQEHHLLSTHTHCSFFSGSSGVGLVFSFSPIIIINCHIVCVFESGPSGLRPHIANACGVNGNSLHWAPPGTVHRSELMI